jgi:hypothetical protein
MVAMTDMRCSSREEGVGSSDVEVPLTGAGAT